MTGNVEIDRMTRQTLTINQDLWISALLSGEYEQTQFSLEDGRGHCCLGIGCEVYEKATGIKLPRDDVEHLIGGGLSDTKELMKVQEWLGLITSDGSFNNKKDCLETRNDKSFNTFPEIAKLIIDYQEELFVPKSLRGNAND